MANVTHKFFIYLSIYYCLTCFGLSITPSSEAGVQLSRLLGPVSAPGLAGALTPYSGDQET
jgi:hypothetical protein